MPTVALIVIVADVDFEPPELEQPPANVATITRNAPAYASLPPRTFAVFLRRHNPASSMNSQPSTGRNNAFARPRNPRSLPAPNTPPSAFEDFPPSAAPAAPSLIVSCVLTAELSSVKDVGANAHETPAGRPVHENWIVSSVSSAGFFLRSIPVVEGVAVIVVTPG